jgi:hypothetical protein
MSRSKPIVYLLLIPLVSSTAIVPMVAIMISKEGKVRKVSTELVGDYTIPEVGVVDVVEVLQAICINATKLLYYIV